MATASLAVESDSSCHECPQMRREMAAAAFGVLEPCGRRCVNLRQTFAPDPLALTCLLRVVFLAMSVCSLTLVLRDTPAANRSFFMAYLTHWGLCAALLYQLSALTCAAVAGCGWDWCGDNGVALLSLEQPRSYAGVCPSLAREGDGNSDCYGERDDAGSSDTASHISDASLYGPHSLLVRLTWASFTLAAPAEVIITMLYWILDHRPGDPVGFTILMNHGGIGLLLVLDGLMIGGIPFRVAQMPLFVIFCMAYLSWTLIFAKSDISNPNRADDDRIYDAIRWNEDPKDAILLSALCAVVLPPAVFLLLRAISLRRRKLVPSIQMGLGGSHDHVLDNINDEEDFCTNNVGEGIQLEMATFISSTVENSVL